MGVVADFAAEYSTLGERLNLAFQRRVMNVSSKHKSVAGDPSLNKEGASAIGAALLPSASSVVASTPSTPFG